MASLGDLIVRVGANIAEFESSMATVSARLDGIAKKADDSFRGFDRIGQQMATLGAGLTAAVTVPLAGVGLAAVQAAGQMEQASVGFKTLLGSAQAAGQMLEQLKAFALTTPFNFPDVVTAAQRLMAMGTAAKDVIPVMTSIGNAVSAMGKGMPEFDRIALAFSQMSNSAKLSAADMRQFTEAGIAGWRYLAEATGISTKEIQEKAKDVLTGAQAAQIILKGMQKDFAGAMIDQSKTMLGMWSNVQDAIKFTFADIGKALLPLAKQITTDFILPTLEGLKSLANWFAQLPAPVQDVVIAVAALAAAAGPLLLAIGGMSMGFSALMTGITAFGGAATLLAGTISNVAFAITNGLTGALSGGEMAILRMGQAAGIAGAAFVGWELGKWAYANIPAVKALGDAIADIILKIPGIQSFIDKQGGLNKANEQLAVSTQKLSNFLKEHGVVVERGNKSLDEWATAVTKAAQEYNKLHPGVQKATDTAKAHTTAITAGTTAHTAHAKAIANTSESVRKFDSQEQQLLKQLVELKKAQEQANKDIEKWNQDVKNGVGPMWDLAHALDGFQVSMSRIDLTKLDRSLQDTIRQADALGDAMRRQGVTSSTALRQLADQAQKDYETIKNSGVATVGEIEAAQRKAIEAQIAYKRSIGESTTELEAQLKKMGDAEKGKASESKTVWGQISQDISDAIQTFGRTLGRTFEDMLRGEFSLDKLKQAAAQLGDQILESLMNKGAKAVGDFIANHLSQLFDWLGKILERIPLIGDALGKVFGAAGDQISVPDIPGGSSGGGSTPPTNPGGGGGGGGTGGIGGLSGIVGMVTGVISAVTGVISVFQNMHQETSLNAIEHNTRYSMMFLGERADQGILGILFKIDEEIAWGSTNKMIMSIRDKFLSWADMAMGNLDEIKSTLWAIRDSMGNIASVQMAPAAAGGGAGATVNINNATILDQRTVDTVARRVVDTLRRGGGRI